MALFEVILISIIGLFACGLFVWFIFGRKNEEKGSDAFLMLQKQLEDIRNTMDSKLGESSKVMQRQFGESAKIVRDVTERLTKLDETNRQVLNFSDQLKNLQDILKNPKQRGVLGEYYLEETLKNVLPPNSYQMQYKFEDGEIADAAVFVKDKIIPVDSKFSLENYERILNERDENERQHLEKQFKQDLKNRIDETSKYVRPNEDTMDFAFMFIPSEAIYYDLLVNKVGAVKIATRDLIEYAFRDKHVIIVSPTSFLAYLQTVLQGLRALQIEESAKEIRVRVEDLGRHLKSYDDFMKKLGNNLGSVVSTYNKASKEFKKIDKDVLRISGEGIDTEVLSLDKPEDE
ncbi:MAG: DNA recombination protein RmuC [Candidatus Tagabacteria bacterium CG09_land_8_20_14_0_10_41_14]|uniref:DNA recombination protein RmuC n=2 Tax=Candidatus Tagaibacteriota TaxID=1817918 RepID=A0A2H0WM52_9BACT|nr:MAG: DNA recombination protein RmuC [Candidatus Tagabacteria bacterium CG09_land_8_20_14_0_10_41_14]PJE73182.1 MAG: DNA recombination protein RmuC [Candidatus Tagabacteria bacterium CG10_big_fil_rev_8_21_14_0_10_40_13]